MKFEEVVSALKEGKKIRRKNWNKIHEIHVAKSESDIVDKNGDYFPFILEDFLANDWEIFEEPLLTDDEKVFIKNVLSFLNNKEIKGIKLTYYPHCYLYFISFNADSYKSLFNFEMCYQSENRTYFKNLELDHYYTLKELGLDEFSEPKEEL